MTLNEQPIAVIAMGRFPQETGAAEEAGHDPGAQVVRVYGGVGKACAALAAGECELAVTDAGELAPGTLRGTLVLRLLDRALLDGDLVHRVIWPDDLAVEEGYPPVHTPGDGRPRVVVWSGRTREEAESVRRGLAGFFAGLPADRFADAVGTLQQGRAHHPVRGAVVCRSAGEAALALGREHTYEQEPVSLALPAAAPGLYGVERVFTEAVDVCAETLSKSRGVELFGDESRGVELRTDGTGTYAAFATAYGLAATLAAWGVRAEAPDPALLTTGRPLEEVTAELAGGGIPVGGDLPGLLAAVARFWTGGGRVDWAALDPDHPLQRLHIPRPEPEPPASVEEPRPLSAVPYSFWVLEQLAPDSGVSNLAVALRFEAQLRRLPLQIAANRLVKRHPALRLRFPSTTGSPVRHLAGPQDVQLKVETRATTEETLVADLQAFVSEPFDLGRDLLVRLGHFTLPDGAGTVVCLAGHHVVMDGTSMQLLVEELGRYYDSQTGHGTLPPELAAPAPMLEPGEPSEESIGYWLDRLDGVDPAAMVLPGSRHSPAHPTFAGHTCSWQVDAETVAALEELRVRLRTTGNIVLAAAFLLTLRGHGAGPDLVIGMPVSTRSAEQRAHVGYAVSTLPLRVQVELDDDFEQVARRVEEAFAEGVEHADASVESVLTRRGHGTDDWRVPLFRHMFNYRPWSDEKVHIHGEVPGYVEDIIDRSRLDLQCNVIQEPDRLTVRMVHSTEVHDEDEIAAFTARMCAVVRQAASGAVHDVLSPADLALLDRVNDTRRTWAGTLTERIATGPGVAVREGGREVGHDELLGRAAAVRDLLRERGVRRGDVVALALDRSADLVAAVLGVWQAGAAFLPLDVRQPELRLAYQVADSGARLVVAAGAPQWAGDTPVAPMPATGTPATTRAQEPGDPADIAYVIYTSGSTGLPKGVQVTHGNLTNLVLDFADRLGTPSRVLWSTTTSFDISWLELLLPLASGGTVVVASDEDQLHPGRFLELIAAADVQVVQATPTAWRLIAPEAGRELAGRTVLCGGEPMPAALARDLLELDCRVFNVYGPTETTIWSTAAELREPPADPVPAGEPLANTRLFVTDATGRELPPGVPGELCVAGDGVSAGYLNRPELTAERFGRHDRYGRFYRTGDRARIRHDGALELLGRDDRQIKLRGHRIELGEVEAALHEHRAVRTAAVILDGDPQTDGRLVAFIEAPSEAPSEAQSEAQSEAPRDEQELREELWRFAVTRLPDYAVPTGYVFTDRLPTTANGKIAYRDLVVPAEHRAQVRDAGAGLVGQVVALWQDALNRPGLGPHDNFFLNGGHSVLAVRLIRPLEELAGRPVSVRAVFDHPTPAELAAHLGEAR
ncbi:amino acid adenylation domain-containing protein [Nonomuraea sp. NN258]|uniref:amino acid adenylation domain-containing protein n=1 Tax=Nonomuraea antri TaxID=2730852 RepID=UPI0015683161|nr:non-ribosomal peptide synthetase [Nonomuraea antri]NRQ35529.1 amino acid adenylation domain-containing protein [Nonomuraea antri]